MVNKIKKIDLYKKIKQSNVLVEKDVENIYRSAISEALPECAINSPFNCDGLLQYNKLSCLLEFKKDWDFTNRINVCKVLVQILYYLKKIERNGVILPSMIIVGDEFTCFYLHVNYLQEYLDFDGVDWSLPPSSAYKSNKKLVETMYDDEEIIPYIFEIDEYFSFKDFLQNVIDCNEDVIKLIRITEKNIFRIFEHFCKMVVKNETKTGKEKYSGSILAGVFLQQIINPEGNYLHPKKKDCLVSTVSKQNTEIMVNVDKYKSFFKRFEMEYTHEETAMLISMTDQLIDDYERRMRGAFFTPKIWVDEAHYQISNVLGENWKEEYVVWNCACGVGNLTRDYVFSQLYCSNVEDTELEIMKNANISPEAEIFNYDFLGGMINEFNSDGIPKTLYNHLKDRKKKILFFINPPYADNGSDGRAESAKDNKKYISETEIKKSMGDDNLRSASRNLYVQFLYKIMKIKEEFNSDVTIAIFSPIKFLTGASFKKFNELFLNNFKITYQFMFNSKYFNGCSDRWGVGFSIFESGKENNKKSFTLQLKGVSEGGEVIDVGKKTFRTNINDTSDQLNKWLEKSNGRDVFEEGCVFVPPLTNPINVKYSSKLYKKPIKSLGLLSHGVHIVNENTKSVSLFSTCAYETRGCKWVFDYNFTKICSYFLVRQMPSTWVNAVDSYSYPYIIEEGGDDDYYKQWVNDCVISSLFNSQSQQSSLRNIKRGNKSYDIENEWFWMSNDEIKKLSNGEKQSLVYSDCNRFQSDRFVYKWIDTHKTSKDSEELLEMAKEIVRVTMKYRTLFNDECPKYHINCWDAGWYQIKGMAKEFEPKLLEEFNKKYNMLLNRLLEPVYDMGWLIKNEMN